MATVKIGRFPSYTNETNFTHDVTEQLGIEVQKDMYDEYLVISQVFYDQHREDVDRLVKQNGGEIIT